MGTKQTIDREAVKTLFVRGFTYREIAEAVGASRVGIWKCLREFGLRRPVRKIAS